MAFLHATIATEGVKLTGPETWRRWHHEFQAEAVVRRLWDYIDPASLRRGQFRAEPLEPRRADYAGPNGPQSRQQGLRSYKEYEVDVSLYLGNYTRYETERRNIEWLATWVRQTVSPAIFQTTWKPMEPLDSWYEALVTRVSLTKDRAKSRAYKQYKEAVKPLTNPPLNWAEWVANWDLAVHDAVSTGLFA